ncbi:hypothetical protein A2U01_0090392, partial [Trifolium medium]|nr:hypothetical protein [Trifolium medium]
MSGNISRELGNWTKIRTL